MMGKGILGLGDIVDRLSIVNIKISLLEGIVKDETKTNQEAGKAARLIRQINMERNTLRNYLNQWSGKGFEEIKVESLKILEKK